MISKDSGNNSLDPIVLISLCEIESLGVRSLHSFLKEKGVNVKIIFLKDRIMNDIPDILETDIAALITLLGEINPSLVGVSFFSGIYQDTVRITERIQKELGKFVIWGGIHAIVKPEESIRTADAVCSGEGEYSLLDFYQRYISKGNYYETPGFLVKHNGQIYRNPLCHLVEELDSIPMSDFSDANKYYIRNDGSIYEGEPFFDNRGRSQYFQSSYFIQATRGCPFNCTYCSESALKEAKLKTDKRFRIRSVKGVINELVNVKKIFPDLKEIGFRDDIFPFYGKNLEEFCKEYKENVSLPFRTHLHPNLINEKTINALADSGLLEIKTGIQSGSERVRKEVFNRKTSDAHLLKVANIMNRSGVKVMYDIILDNPWETEEDRDQGIEFLLKIATPYDLRLFSLCYFPGASLTNRALAEGLIDETQVDGADDKGKNQWRMTLDRERSITSLHWALTLSLLSKPFIPRSLIRYIYHSKFLRKHTHILSSFVTICNVIKTGQRGMSMLSKGKINLEFVKTQWRNAIKINQ